MKTAIDEVLGRGKPQKKVAKKGMEAKDLDIQLMAARVAIAGERKSETKFEFRSHAKAFDMAFEREGRRGFKSLVQPRC